MQAMILQTTGSIDDGPLMPAQVDDPQPGPREVRLRVVCCAICRTDLHIIEGDLPEVRRPIIPGHQIVGHVDVPGEGSTQFKVGDRAGIAWLRSTDGSCAFCRSGRENLCPASKYTGYHVDGGYAQYAVVPEAYAYHIPEPFSDVAAAPLLCAGIIGYRSLKRACVPDGGRLLLIGFGSSAHIVLQIALYRGYQVSVMTRSAAHQQLARDLGAAWAGDDFGRLPTKVDSAILFAPVGALVGPALAALQRGGTLSIAGIHLSDIPPLRYQEHLFNERDIHPVTANTRGDGRALLLEAAAAQVQPRTTTYALTDANAALQDMKHDRLSGTGVLVMP